MNQDERSFEDPLNETEAKNFLAEAEREMFPKMKASAMSLVISSDEPDAKLALEVGAAILFDKPLLIVILKGRSISPALRRVATEIVEVEDFTSADSQRILAEAINRILPK